VLPAEYHAMHLVELTHWWFRGRRRLLVSFLARVGGARAGALRILDYGCGTGGNTTSYGQFGSVIGVEPDPHAVRLAQARGGGSYCRADGVRLPFRNGTFDVVIASDVLEHIEDDSGAMAEMARVLRPGGSMIISVPAHQWLFSYHDAALHHFRRYSKATLRSLLGRERLRIRRLSYWNTTLFPLLSLYRLLQQQRRRPLPRSDTRLPPGLINQALAVLLSAEAALVRHVGLPWGLSLVVVAESYEERPPQASRAPSEESAGAGVATLPADDRRNTTASESQYH
jgi:SAM-dependent methyltransferase